MKKNKSELEGKEFVGDLKPALYNPRKIDSWHLNAMKEAMEELGPLDGIVKNIRTGNLVGGHQRVKNLSDAFEIVKSPFTDPTGTTAMGYIETPYGRWSYREVDWDDKKEKLANIAANKHGGEWDMTKLVSLLGDLDDGSMDFGLAGFTDVEMDKMMNWLPESKSENSLGSAAINADDFISKDLDEDARLRTIKVNLEIGQVKYLDNLAELGGLSRSDVVRELVGVAMDSANRK